MLKLISIVVITVLYCKTSYFPCIEYIEFKKSFEIILIVKSTFHYIVIKKKLFYLKNFFYSAPVLKYVVLCWKLWRSKHITGSLFLLTLPDSTVILQLTFWLAWWSDDDDDDLPLPQFSFSAAIPHPVL